MDLHFLQSPEFRNWLARQDGAALASIAERISLRGAPMWLARISKGGGHPREPKYTPYLRSLVTTSALRAFPGEEQLQRLSLTAGFKAKIYLDTNGAFYPAAAVLSYADGNSYNHDASAYDSYFTRDYGGRWAMDDVAQDVITVANGERLLGQPLWRTAPFLAEEEWLEVKNEWAKHGETFAFWLRWYEAALLGEQLDPGTLMQIALIPDEVWDAGPGAVAEKIAEIEARFRNKANLAQAEALLHAALADYTFDAIKRVMRMVPFEDDIRHLRDPARLASFLDDADAMRDDLELFARGLVAEGAMQHAGFVRTYLDGVLEEFSRARQMNHLRVGRVVELGKILEEYAASEQVAAEFGPAIHALRSHVQNLLDLTRRHFAATMTRMAPLRDLTSGPDDNQWDLLQDIQRGIRAIAAPFQVGRPPLAKEDEAVLLSMADSIERLLRQNAVVTTPEGKSSLRREVDYGIAMLTVSVGLYLEKAKAEGHGPGKVLDWIATQHKRVTSVVGLWKLIRSLLP